MTKKKKSAKVDGYLGRATRWQAEMTKLRAILLQCPLTEELKWGKPCYTLEGKNVVLIVGFKEYCALLFGKGALFKDPKGILIQPTENTRATRQIRFTGIEEIKNLERVLKAYVDEAIAVEKSGLEVTYKKVTEFKLPEELQSAFKESPALKKAFLALTPGRQRGYILYFSGAKQSKTREARIEKCTPQIFDGKGLND